MLVVDYKYLCQEIACKNSILLSHPLQRKILIAIMDQWNSEIDEQIGNACGKKKSTVCKVARCKRAVTLKAT